MANPYDRQALEEASRVAGFAAELTEVAERMVNFLQQHLPTGYATHKVQVVSVTLRDPHKDFVLETPLGQVWARFGFRQGGPDGLNGVLHLFSVGGSLDAGIMLKPLHDMIFNRHGFASFNESAEQGWDWDFNEEIVPSPQAARAFARIVVLKQRDLTPGR